MIQAKVLADSQIEIGDNERLTTFEVVFPRFILAELNTHRALSRNSASSRAIPFKKMVESVRTNPFVPTAWQIDHSGMQGSKYIEDKNIIGLKNEMWLEARDDMVARAIELNSEVLLDDELVASTNVTKQLCNRLLEPFLWHRVIITGSEWENFFKLRCSNYEVYDNSKLLKFNSINDCLKSCPDLNDLNILEWLGLNKAQAEIHMMLLAEAMWDAYNASTPKVLKAGEWHLPYGDNFDVEKLDVLKSSTYSDGFYKLGDFCYTGASGASKFDTEVKKQLNIDPYIDLKVKISSARCARISYKTLGDNAEINHEADIKLHDRLTNNGHASPFEHPARAMSYGEYTNFVKKEVKYDKFGDMQIVKTEYGWCRNFKGFVQYRHLLNV